MNKAARDCAQMRTTHRARGSSTLELVFGLILLVPLVLTAIELALIVEGVCENERACREAAKAAASGPPDLLVAGAAQGLADAVLLKYRDVSGLIRFNPACVVQESVIPPLPQPPLGGAVEGQVTVKTTVNVYTPFLIGFIARRRCLSFTDTEQCPYTYLVPCTMQETPQTFSVGPWP